MYQSINNGINVDTMCNGLRKKGLTYCEKRISWKIRT